VTDSITFSLILPQAGLSYAMVRERAAILESLGYDGLWLIDHMFPKGMPDVDLLEGWTTLAGLAEATKRLRLGLLVTCNSFRNPALLAKMAATVDHISHGRLELGLGAGWMEEEYRAYGWPFASVGERLAQLGEALEVITRLTTESPATFHGKHYTLEEAPFAPKPLQSPIPITIGGAGEKVLLALVARYAQRWNCPMPAAPEVARLLGVLEGHCRKIGRDVAEIVVSEQTAVIVGRDDAHLREKRQLARMMIGGWVDIKTMAVVGNPAQVIEGLRAKIDRGVRDFAIVFGDLGMQDTLELFAAQVVPALRAG